MSVRSPQQNSRWRLFVLLIMAAIAVSACSIIAVPENTQPLYQGPPQVSIAAPQPNDTYQEGVGVNILVRVENAGPDVARVAILMDGQIIGEAPLPNPDGAPSFTIRNGWTASGPGQHTISISASRADGTQGTPASVIINVVAAPTSQTTSGTTLQPAADTNAAQTVPEQPTIAPTNTLPPPTQVQPTDVPAPTEVPVTDTPSKPQVRVTTGANIRRGPGTNFDPPIGSLAVGATADLLAVNLDGSWYKIRYYNSDGWIFGSTVELVGDTSDLPREAGPPTPIPFTPTPVATNTPVAVADLRIQHASTSPFPFECGRDSEIQVTVINNGTGNSGDTRVIIEDIYKRTGQVQEKTEAPVRGLAPGETTTVTMYLRVSTYVGEGHTSRVRVDPDNRVAETNENNNEDADDYPLANGDC